MDYITHNYIYKILLQYYFIDNKNDIIYDLTNLSDFNQYLNISQKIYNIININKSIKEGDYYCSNFFFNNLLLKNDLCYSIKLSELYDELKNPFLNPISNSKKLYHFYKIQKNYFSLLKFIYICKNKILIPTNKEDLLGNELNKHDSFNHIENNKLYLFSYSDILNLFINNICYCDNYFFSYPKHICNPYTQGRFTTTNLYNMYFFIKKNCILYSKIHIIDSFFHHNFNLIDFSKNNESLITKQNIKRFVINEPNAVLYPFIKELIKYSNSVILNKTKYCIHIDEEFPKKLLCDIFRPYLYNFLNNKYTCDNVFRYFCFSKLNQQIIRFAKNSHTFGRRIFKRNCPKESKIRFITKHIDFYKNDIISINIDYSNIEKYNIPFFDNDPLDDEYSISQSNDTDFTESDDDDDDNVTVILNVPNIFPDNNIIQNGQTSDISQNLYDDSATVIVQTP